MHPREIGTLVDQNFLTKQLVEGHSTRVTVPYLNGTVREKYGIVRYFTRDRIRYDTVRYQTVPDSTEQYRTVPVQYRTDRPNKLGHQDKISALVKSEAKQARQFNEGLMEGHMLLGRLRSHVTTKVTIF